MCLHFFFYGMFLISLTLKQPEALLLTLITGQKNVMLRNQAFREFSWQQGNMPF